MIAILAQASLSWADEQSHEKEALCRMDDTTTLAQAEASHVPNYFFRPFPDSDFVSYASANRNYILDLEKGAEIEMPGPYDPVPTPDQMLMTIPPGEGLTFYSVEDLKKGKREPLLVDPSLKGVYQSIGTVQSGGGEKTFRVITDQNGLSFRDYHVKEGNGGEKPTITPGGSEPTVLCKGMRLSLPMISKDGKQIAALDVNAGITKIFDIEPSSGACTEVLNLGIPTGKVDFNFNNDEITFHVLNNGSAGNSYFQVPSDSMVANVFVYKRSTGEITRITNNTSSNSVFPAFRRDGKIVYLNHPQRNGLPSAKSSFVVADPSRANSQPFELVGTPTCAPSFGAKSYSAVAALGALWAQLCSKFGKEISDSAAAMIPLGMKPDQCRRLIETKWAALKGDIAKNAEMVKSGRVRQDALKDLDEEDLLAACPKRAFDSVGAGDTGGGDSNVPASTAPVPRVCFECHSDDIPFGDWARLMTERASSGKFFRDEILDRINRTGPGKMPKGNRPLSTEEKTALEKYLRTGE